MIIFNFQNLFNLQIRMRLFRDGAQDYTCLTSSWVMPALLGQGHNLSTKALGVPGSAPAFERITLRDALRDVH